MSIRFSSHGRRRARRWKIEPEEIAEALLNRESERPGDQPGRVVIMGFTSTGRRLKIVVPADDQHFIITCAAQGHRAEGR